MICNIFQLHVQNLLAVYIFQLLTENNYYSSLNDTRAGPKFRESKAPFRKFSPICKKSRFLKNTKKIKTHKIYSNIFEPMRAS